MNRSRCILLVEDDPILGPMTFQAILHLGHQSVLADTVTAAYAHLSNPHGFQLVLLDLQLGEEDSAPMILRLRKEGFELPKIIVLSAQPVVQLQRVARTIGAHHVIQKPASVHDIRHAIEKIAA